MGARIWAGMLFASGTVAFPAGALVLVQLARRWPAVESPGGLALTVGLVWAAVALLALAAARER